MSKNVNNDVSMNLPILSVRGQKLLSELSVQKVAVDRLVTIYMYSDAKACSWLFMFSFGITQVEPYTS